MASIFVSHSSTDRSTTERLREGLQAAGYAALFVDFDPEHGIPAGRDWKRELYAQLRRADAVVFLASAASAASQWCAIEVGLAQSLGTPVVPVRLQPGLRMPLLDDVQWVDGTGAEAGLERLLTGLRTAGLDPDDVAFFKVDIDEVSDVAQEVGIEDISTFLIFRKGKKVNELVGENPAALKKLVDGVAEGY